MNSLIHAGCCLCMSSSGSPQQGVLDPKEKGKNCYQVDVPDASAELRITDLKSAKSPEARGGRTNRDMKYMQYHQSASTRRSNILISEREGYVLLSSLFARRRISARSPIVIILHLRSKRPANPSAFAINAPRPREIARETHRAEEGACWLYLKLESSLK